MKVLTSHQAAVLSRLQSGETPKQIAAYLNTSPNSVYQTRRRLIAGGHLPETGRILIAGGHPAEAQRKSTRKPARRNAASNDPVTVIEQRIGEVTDDINALTALVSAGAAQLRELAEEASRLASAHDALTA